MQVRLPLAVSAAAVTYNDGRSERPSDLPSIRSVRDRSLCLHGGGGAHQRQAGDEEQRRRAHRGGRRGADSSSENTIGTTRSEINEREPNPSAALSHALALLIVVALTRSTEECQPSLFDEQLAVRLAGCSSVGEFFLGFSYAVLALACTQTDVPCLALPVGRVASLAWPTQALIAGFQRKGGCDANENSKEVSVWHEFELRM